MARLIPGVTAAALLIALIGGALAALLAGVTATDFDALWDDEYLHRVVVFTFKQATLSTLLSIGLALPIARALARRPEFPGRTALLRLLGLPLVVPTIVAVFGIVAVYGQSGWLNEFARLLGLPTGQYLYGLPGILIAHVFFNLPLAVRLLLPVLQSIPGETWRLATQLGMPSSALFRFIEWPVLREVLPSVAALVFMLCFTSFAVVLTLGGGPAATTIEVAIYQALRFDFELPRAALLAILQLVFCALVFFVMQRLGRTPQVESVSGIKAVRPAPAGIGRLLDYLLIGLAAVLTILPLLAVLVSAVNSTVVDVLADKALWRSAWLSLRIALASSVVAVLLALALLYASRELRVSRGRHTSADLLELSGSTVLVVPPLVLGTGVFVLLHGRFDVFAWTPALVVGVNALMGLPYALRLLSAPMTRIAQQQNRLCDSLGIRGWQRWRLIEWPQLRTAVGLAAALCAALSTGDLGVVALFAREETTTLPLLLYQRLGAYQMAQGAVTAVVLLALSLLLFVLIERGVGGVRRA